MTFHNGYWSHTPGAGNRSEKEYMMDYPRQVYKHYPSKEWCSSCRYVMPEPLPDECDCCPSKLNKIFNEGFE
jgi:hypothetical protein